MVGPRQFAGITRDKCSAAECMWGLCGDTYRTASGRTAPGAACEAGFFLLVVLEAGSQTRVPAREGGRGLVPRMQPDAATQGGEGFAVKSRKNLELLPSRELPQPSAQTHYGAGLLLRQAGQCEDLGLARGVQLQRRGRRILRR